MSTLKKNFRSPFASAVLGGLVVAVLGLIAIAAGLVQGNGGSTTTVAAPLTAPVDAKAEKGNVVNQIYKADGNGVAFVESQLEPQESETFNPFNPFGEEQQPRSGGTATGSGFVIDGEGHILTNNHVIEGAEKITVKLGESERTYTAKVVGTDPGTDIALLQVDAPAKELHPLTLGHSSEVEVGDPVVAIGNPFGLDRTVTSGIVSALQRQIQAPNGFSIDHVIQTDAAINPGNSGGPLINAQGEVIGINSQIATAGGGAEGNVGIGFAIPIDTVRKEIHDLETKGEVEHAFLGISGGTITPELAKALNLPVDEGVLIQTVVNGSPADKAGLKGGHTTATINGAEVRLGGDIITEVNGKKITTMEELAERIGESKPGDEIELTVFNGGEEETVNATLGRQPKKAQ
ncbi:MAG: S1C family serine protease [Solirubrobacterales bacterium]